MPDREPRAKRAKLTPEQFHEAMVRAGRKRAAQFTPEYQRAARAKQPREAVVRAGRAGFRAALAKGLPRKALEGIARYHAAHPSREEERVAGILVLQQREFVREAILGTDDGEWIVDFLVDGAIIEVNGGVHDPTNTIFDPARKLAAQTRKLAALIGRGYPVLVLQHDEQELWEKQITSFLAPKVAHQLSYIPF